MRTSEGAKRPKARARIAAICIVSAALGGIGIIAASPRADTDTAATTAPDASRQPQAFTAPQFTWTRSLPVTFEDPSIGTFGGTELRAIVGLDGKLYAANTYWNDSEQRNPALPGGQIYRLDEPDGEWQVEYELPKTAKNTIAKNTTAKNKKRARRPKRQRRSKATDKRIYQGFANLVTVTFTQDKFDNPLLRETTLLLAGVFSRGKSIDVFQRNPDGDWGLNAIPPQSYLPDGSQVRPFAVHKDAVTGAEKVFAGGSDVIFSGQYNAKTKSIDWSATPDWIGENPAKNNIQSKGGRVTSFAVCGGKLYAAGREIYERQDGESPTWKAVYSLPLPDTDRNLRGLSGLTCGRGLTGVPALYAGYQGAGALIVRIDLGANEPSSEVELDVGRFLTGVLGTEVKSAIIAYNDVTIYPGTDPACPFSLFGFTAYTPQQPRTFARTRKSPKAGFLVRDCKGDYGVEWAEDTSIKPDPYLVGVRAIALSPFVEDPEGTIYAGGFDAGNPFPPGVHNTAWLYKGVRSDGQSSSAR